MLELYLLKKMKEKRLKKNLVRFFFQKKKNENLKFKILFYEIEKPKPKILENKEEHIKDLEAAVYASKLVSYVFIVFTKKKRI